MFENRITTPNYQTLPPKKKQELLRLLADLLREHVVAVHAGSVESEVRDDA